VLELGGKSEPAELAWARLCTAWTQRFEWGKTVPERLWEKARQLRARDKEKLPEDPYRVSMTIARTLEEEAEGPDGKAIAAVMLFTRGELPEAERVLDALDAEKDLPKDLRALVAELRARAEREKKYLALAVPLLKQAAERSGEPHGQRYLVGELQRKLGRKEQAVAALKQLLEDAALPKGLRPWVEESLRKTRG